MLTKKTFAIVGALALALLGAQPSFAQDPSVGDRSESERASGTTRGERVLPGRIGGDRSDRAQQQQQRNQRQARPPAPPTPEENKAAAQALAASASLSCQVNEANRLGVNAEQQAVYEVTCASGPGYILIGSTPPQTFDCIELKGQAEQARARDPNADVGQQCAIPANLDSLAVIKGYATEAGLTCPIDEAAVIGKSSAGNVVYEVGCGSAPGYWLERQATGWLLTDCLQVVSTNGTCRFTTMEEEAAAFQPKLAGTEAAACQIQQVRLMGQNANGRFYEAKCAAGDGFIARVKDDATQQVYACATAQRIGGGCTLTPAPALPPETPATTEQQ